MTLTDAGNLGGTLREAVDSIAHTAFGRTLTDSWEARICVMCGETAVGFRDRLSRKEYDISGMCQECQDRILG